MMAALPGPCQSQGLAMWKSHEQCLVPKLHFGIHLIRYYALGFLSPKTPLVIEKMSHSSRPGANQRTDCPPLRVICIILI